jgi:CBS domain-containing protein
MAKRKIPPPLQKAAEQVHASNRPRSVGVRTFLSWFGVKRRGYHVVRDIRYFLKRAKIVTEPDFEIANIEGRVKLRPILTTKRLKEDPVAGVIELPIGTTSPETHVIISDPTPRLGTLDPANRKPLSLNRDAKVREAVTLMVQHDYSQLPVMQNLRDVDGLISWKSIGEASKVHNKECIFVRECMDSDVEILNHNTPLWKAIKTISEKNVVLVRNVSKEIVGLVTTYDIAVEYHTLSEPFLLLGEIENNLRQLIARAKYPLSVLEAAKDPKDTERTVTGVSDLTFGEYIELLQDPENWRSIGFNLSRKTFIAEMTKIRKIRNEVMHFHPDPLTKEQLDSLRNVANMMRGLKLWNVS